MQAAEHTLVEIKELLRISGIVIGVTVDTIAEIAKGNVAGVKIMRGLGERDSIQTTAQGEDIWRGNELSATPSALASHVSIPIPADAGEQMTLVSENDADNGASATGALTVVVSYLDAAGDEQEEEVTLDGTTQVDTVAEDIRFVQDIQVSSVGSNGVAEGHIRIFKESDETLVYSMIAAGGNQSLVPHKMVPRAKTLCLWRWMGSEASKSKRCRIRLRADCTNMVPPVRQAGVFLFKSVMALDGSGLPMELAYTIPAFSIVKVSAWAEVAGAEIGTHWWGILVDD